MRRRMEDGEDKEEEEEGGESGFEAGGGSGCILWIERFTDGQIDRHRGWMDRYTEMAEDG